MKMADTSNRGFGSMDPQKQREIASKGGKSQGAQNNPANFANDPQKAAEAGQKGGQSQGAQNNPANFANDPQKASEAGQKGGRAAQQSGNAHELTEEERSEGGS